MPNQLRFTNILLKIVILKIWLIKNCVPFLPGILFFSYCTGVTWIGSVSCMWKRCEMPWNCKEVLWACWRFSQGYILLVLSAMKVKIECFHFFICYHNIWILFVFLFLFIMVNKLRLLLPLHLKCYERNKALENHGSCRYDPSYFTCFFDWDYTLHFCESSSPMFSLSFYLY